MRRGILVLTGFLITGALAMNEADGQEKKSEPPPLKAPYTMYVTVKTWRANDNRFSNPVENVAAYWYKRDDGKTQDKNGNDLLACHTKGGIGSADPKTEITDKDGNVYVTVGAADRLAPGTVVFPVRKKPKD